MLRLAHLFFWFAFLIGSSMAWAEPLDINSANAEQLALAMTGVGKVKAEAIIKDRELNGTFKSVDDLTRVKGIKSSTIEKNRDKLTVGQASQPPSPEAPKQ